MNDLRKAAEMALEALEALWDILDDIDTASDMAKENDAWYRKRVEALQKKRWDTMITTDGHKLKGGPVEALRQALAEPEQEPVCFLRETSWSYEIAPWDDPNGIPVYIAPPKREWVGIEPQEIGQIWAKHKEVYGFGIELEQVLTERNT